MQNARKGSYLSPRSSLDQPHIPSWNADPRGHPTAFGDIISQFLQNLAERCIFGGARIIRKFHKHAAILVVRLYRLDLESVCLDSIEHGGQSSNEGLFAEYADIMAETIGRAWSLDVASMV